MNITCTLDSGLRSLLNRYQLELLTNRSIDRLWNELIESQIRQLSGVLISNQDIITFKLMLDVKAWRFEDCRLICDVAFKVRTGLWRSLQTVYCQYRWLPHKALSPSTHQSSKIVAHYPFSCLLKIKEINYCKISLNILFSKRKITFLFENYYQR